MSFVGVGGCDSIMGFDRHMAIQAKRRVEWETGFTGGCDVSPEYLILTELIDAATSSIHIH